MKIAILSTDKLPKFLGDDHPMEDSLFSEDDLLIAELAEIAISAERVSWRRRDVDWSRFEAAVIRSTWDYIDSPGFFITTLEKLGGLGIRIINPLETVRWNSDKRYLEELVKKDLPVVPTCFLTDRSAAAVPREWFSEGKKVVLKPTVGVGGFGVKVARTPSELNEGLSSFDIDCPLMVQPFLSSVTSEGEWSFVFGAGRLLYSVVKKPADGDYRVQAMYGSTTTEEIPSDNDRKTAEQIARSLPVDAALMRIDMARLDNGKLALMEAELIEPQLYLYDVPLAAKKLALAIKQVLLGAKD